MKKCRYAGIETYDINNGTGFGVTLFVQGCSHHCDGCHNPSTWDFDGGMVFTEDVKEKLFEVLDNENIRRLTISGGEPFDNLDLVIPIAKEFKDKHPSKQLWIYTGYTFEDIEQILDASGLLDICNVIVDGEYKKDKRDLSLGFRGSSNQRIINILHMI